MITRYLFSFKGRDELKPQQKFLNVFHMDHRNFSKDLLVAIYYPNHEETSFDQSVSGFYIL